MAPEEDQHDESKYDTERGHHDDDNEEVCYEEEEEEPEPKSQHQWQTPRFLNKWNRKRFIITFVGCLSSCLVLIIRLLLDGSYSSAYLIHSIIIFFDMILIHIFTQTLWLSIGGELLTYIFLISFHFTKQFLFELLETTLIAVICSFNLLGSRNQAIAEKHELEDEVEEIKRRGSILLHNITNVQHELAHIVEEEEKNDEEEEEEVQPLAVQPTPAVLILRNDSIRDDEQSEDGDLRLELLELCRRHANPFTMAQNLYVWLIPDDDNDNDAAGAYYHHKVKTHIKWCGDAFFEYFLDGAAGVMYTSFLGLIIDEIIHYSTNVPKK